MVIGTLLILGAAGGFVALAEHGDIEWAHRCEVQGGEAVWSNGSIRACVFWSEKRIMTR